jgi:hypothetical protein
MLRTSFRDDPSLQQRRGRAALHTSVRFRPQVEALEDRTVASSTTLTVTPNPATAGQTLTLAASATGVAGKFMGPGLPFNFSVQFEFYSSGTLLGQRSQNFTAFSPQATVSDQLAVPLPAGMHFLHVKLVNLHEPGTRSTSPIVFVPVDHPPQTNLAGVVSLTRSLLQFNARKGRLLQSLIVLSTSPLVQRVQGQLFLVLTGLNRKARVRGAGSDFQRAVAGRVAINLNMDQLVPGHPVGLILEFRGVTPRQLNRIAASILVGPQ